MFGLPQLIITRRFWRHQQEFTIHMAKTLTITDEKVKAGAARCADAKAVLKEMFPEAFTKTVDLRKLRGNGPYGPTDTIIDGNATKAKEAFDLNSSLSHHLIQIRTGGRYANKGFLLSPEFVWVIAKDEGGSSILIPTAQRD